MTQFNIKIVSDTVCPWCYIGKKKLERAIKAYEELHPESNDTFSTTWMPFYLNPDAPKIGVDKNAYIQAKFGEVRTAMIYGRLVEAGEASGIDFKFGGKTGNTRDSHRLIQLAKSKSLALQTEVIEELFKVYFEQEGDITNHEVLRNAAVRAGLKDEEVREWLASDKGGNVVDEEVREAIRNHVSGVPNFTVQGKYKVGGAQEQGDFVRLFEEIKAVEK